MNAGLRKAYLCVKTHVEIVAPETAHILDNNRSNFAFLNIVDHSLETGPVEICTAPTIIYIELRVRIAMLLCIATEEAFLIAYAVGFRIRSVIS